MAGTEQSDVQVGDSVQRCRAQLAAVGRGRGRVRLHRDGDVAQLVMDSADARNALSPGMMMDFGAAVDALEGGPEAAVVLRGEGTRAFCAGGDLASVRSHLLSTDLAQAMSVCMQDSLARLQSLPLVRIVALEGAAIGGGAELLTVGDRVFAGRSARVGFVHASLGVSPGWGGGGRLVDRVGALRALRVLTHTGLLSSEDALLMGVVDDVVGDGTALDHALAWARELAQLPRAALAAAVQVSRGLDPAAERAVFLSLWGGEAHREALERTRQGR